MLNVAVQEVTVPVPIVIFPALAFPVMAGVVPQEERVGAVVPEPKIS